MKIALLYSYDPPRANPAEGEVSDWLTLDAEIKEANAHVAPTRTEPISIRRAPLGR
ncbi:MAG TPA: hypothetical protein VK869_08565 [Rubrobacteraceae bacterium]|nr:hypothetical protein [Rubrobacteraceae bacterium]